MATNPVVTFTTDAAPTLVSSNANIRATDVAVGSDVVLTFSEPVAVPAAALDLGCAASPGRLHGGGQRHVDDHGQPGGCPAGIRRVC